MNSGPVADWYIETPSTSPGQSQQSGPFTAEQIQAQLGRGEITVSHKVTAEWLCGEWITVADLIAGYQAAHSTHAPTPPSAPAQAEVVRMEVLQEAVQPVPQAAPPAAATETISFAVSEPPIAPTAVDAMAPVRTGPFSPPPRPPEFLDVASTAEAVRPTHDPNLELFDTLQAAREKKGGPRPAPSTSSLQTESSSTSDRPIWEKITPRMWKQLGVVLGGVLLVWAVITFVSRPAPQPPQSKEVAAEPARDTHDTREVRGGSATAPGFRSGGSDFTPPPQHGGGTAPNVGAHQQGGPQGSGSRRFAAPPPTSYEASPQDAPPPPQPEYIPPQENIDTTPPPVIEAPPPPPNEAEGQNLAPPPGPEANP